MGVLATVVGCSLVGPAPAPAPLRASYVAALQRYADTPYVWGGESHAGIDCSGLARRGLIEALLARGAPRQALGLWWRDCTARELGAGYRGLTRPVCDAPCLQALDPSGLLPGDLAVTADGRHVLAYLGDRRWIQADPGAQRVVTHPASAANTWHRVPVRVVRWTALSDA